MSVVTGELEQLVDQQINYWPHSGVREQEEEEEEEKEEEEEEKEEAEVIEKGEKKRQWEKDIIDAVVYFK